MDNLARISWTEAEPNVVLREQASMAESCPDMQWREDFEWRDRRAAVGWRGQAPAWPVERPPPVGLDKLMDGRRLHLDVLYPEAFPMVPAHLYPTDPAVPIERRTLHTWHVNGDGSLCLMQSAADWHPNDTAADLVCKAAGWFIEYLLVEANHRDAMTTCGIYSSDELDEIISAEYA